MSSALLYVGACFFLCSVIIILFRIEDSYGDRILLARTRTSLDNFLCNVLHFVGRISQLSLVEYVRLTWHYIVHTLLRRILFFTARTQQAVEDMVRKNKAVAKEIQKRHAQSHLEQIAEHKEQVALSPKERSRRKAQ